MEYTGVTSGMSGPRVESIALNFAEDATSLAACHS